MKVSPRSNRDGFTLVEALVALVVASFVLAAMSGVHNGLSSVERRVARATALQEEVLTTSRFLRTILERSVPGGPGAVGGSVDAIAIRTLGMPLDGVDGPPLLRLSTHRADGTAALVARWPERSPPMEETLLSDPETLRLRYLVNGPTGLVWSESWTDPAHLPLAIALEITHPELGSALTMVFRTGMRSLDPCRSGVDLDGCRRTG